MQTDLRLQCFHVLLKVVYVLIKVAEQSKNLDPSPKYEIGFRGKAYQHRVHTDLIHVHRMPICLL